MILNALAESVFTVRASRLDFRVEHTNPFSHMVFHLAIPGIQYLSLQVGQPHGICVRNSNPANTCRRQVEQNWCTKPSSTTTSTLPASVFTGPLFPVDHVCHRSVVCSHPDVEIPRFPHFDFDLAISVRDFPNGVLPLCHDSWVEQIKLPQSHNMERITYSSGAKWEDIVGYSHCRASRKSREVAGTVATDDNEVVARRRLRSDKVHYR